MQKGFGHWGQGKKVVVALHLDAHGRRFDGAVLQFQIPVATDSHLVSANSIYDGRRKLHKLDEMTNVVSCLIQQARKRAVAKWCDCPPTYPRHGHRHHLC
jgi:hypothetical protein